MAEEDEKSEMAAEDLVNMGEMQYLKLLPDIKGMKIQPWKNDLHVSGSEDPENFEESKRKRIEILKRFLNRKI